MKFSLRYILGAFLVLILSVIIVSSVFGQSTSEEEETKSGLEEIQGRIAEYEEAIGELQNEAKSLSSQIQIVDNQVALTELRIQETEKKIENLQQDIEVTEDKIYGLEDDIDGISRALLNRTLASYKYGKIELWQVLLTSESIDNFFTRLKYLKIVQYYDQKNILNAEQSRVSYANQQDILSSKQDEAETLFSQLDSYNEQLVLDRAAKENLLTLTKNDEKQYQLLLDQAIRELSALASSEFTGKRDVKKGEVIGLMGSTGFSTGPHLHLGYYNLTEDEHNGIFEGGIDWYFSRNSDPRSILQNRSMISYDSSCSTPLGGGSFPWPISNPYITQCYGSTPYSSVYKDNFHRGLDMSTGGSSVLVAIEDGVAYSYRGATSFGNNVRVFHSNGKMSLYLHLQ